MRARGCVRLPTAPQQVATLDWTPVPYGTTALEPDALGQSQLHCSSPAHPFPKPLALLLCQTSQHAPAVVRLAQGFHTS